jgi:hypothetical protein
MKKEHMLHAVATNKDGPILKGVMPDTWELIKNADSEWERFGKPHHLYLTSDEDIKEGDWYLYKMGEFWELMQCMDNEEAERCNTHHLIARHCRKIVATTNPDLWEFDESKFIANSPTFIKGVAKIPQSLIEYFVEKQGKVDSVMVKYNEAIIAESPDEYGENVGILRGEIVRRFKFQGDEPDEYTTKLQEEWIKCNSSIKLNQSGEIIWEPMHKGIDWEKVFEDAHTMHLQEFINYYKNQ